MGKKATLNKPVPGKKKDDKSWFKYYENKVLTNPKYIEATDDDKEKYLGKLYDKYGMSGETDPLKLQQERSKYINSILYSQEDPEMEVPVMEVPTPKVAEAESTRVVPQIDTATKVVDPDTTKVVPTKKQPSGESDQVKRVKEKAEKYYTDKGWPSPTWKLDQFTSSMDILKQQAETGKLDEDTYKEKVNELIKGLGLLKDGDRVYVSENEVKDYRKAIERAYQADLKERKESEKDPFIKDVLDALSIGSAEVLNSPTRLLAMSEKMGNKMLNLMNEDWGKSEYWSDKAKAEKVFNEQWRESNHRYEAGITQLVGQGETAEAVGQTIISLAENLPLLTTLIMGNAVGATNLTLGYMGADKAANEYLTNESDKSLTETTKIINAIGKGFSEVVFENMGTVSILNSVKKAVATAGRQTVREQMISHYSTFLEKQIARLSSGMSNMIIEGSEEMATELTDNIMDIAAGRDVNLDRGVVDAGIVGAVIGLGLSSPQIFAEYKGGKSQYVKDLAEAIPDDMDFEQKLDLADLFVQQSQLEYKMKQEPEGENTKLKKQAGEIQKQIDDLLGVTEAMEKAKQKYREEVGKTFTLDPEFVDKIKSEQAAIDDVAIKEAQERLGLPELPQMNIDEFTAETLDKIHKGDPVLNDRLKFASDNLYDEYKRLDLMRESGTRQYTITQITELMEILEGEITNINNRINEQAGKGEFKTEPVKLTDEVEVSRITDEREGADLEGVPEEPTPKTETDEKPAEEPAEEPAEVKKPILETTVDEVTSMFKGIRTKTDEQIAEQDQVISESEEKIKTEFSGRLTLDQKKAKKAIQADITKAELAKTNIISDWATAVQEYGNEIRPDIEKSIRDLVPTIDDIAMTNTLDKVWTSLQNPSKEEAKLTVEDLILETLAKDEKATKKQEATPTVQPAEEEGQPIKTEEELSEEKIKDFPDISYAGFQEGLEDDPDFPDMSMFAVEVEIDGEKRETTFLAPVDATPEQIRKKADEIAAPFKTKPEDLPIEVPLEEIVPTTEGEQMRMEGERVVNGQTIKRQMPLKNMEEGDITTVRFGKKIQPDGIWAVMEAEDLQPSHLSGTENPKHFIPEAQPRNRASLQSLADAAREKAMNLDPEQLGYSPNAYSGAPITNNRGEVIQGNGRAEAILYYYATQARDPKGYIDYIKENAKSFGLETVDLDKFKEPVLVRKLFIEDQQAIQFGNYGMKDLEDVQESTSDIKQASNRINKDQGLIISNILLKGNEVDDTLNDLIRKNGDDIISKLAEFDVFSQGDAEKFRKGGEITPEGIKAVEGVIKGLFFKGGNINLPELFGELPYTAKMGLEKSIPILLRIPVKQNILPQVRNAMMGLYEYDQYLKTTGEKAAFTDWVNQTSLYEAPVNERFTPLELAIIDKVYKAPKQKDIVKLFMDYENAVKGVSATLFGGAVAGVDRADASRQVFGVEYKETIHDKYEEEIEVPTEPESPELDKKPEEGERTEEEPPIEEVNVDDELKNMIDLLGTIDPDMVDDLAAGADEGIDSRVKMLNTATKLVGKMIDSDITDFDDIISRVIPRVSLPNMKMLLPYIKEGYAAYWASAPVKTKELMGIERSGSFDEVDLDNLIAEINRPKDVDTFEDLTGKTFFVPELDKEITIVRIEEWTDPRDAKVQALGGLFGKAPDQFDKLTVAVLENPTSIQGQERSAVIVDKIRKLISEGRVKEIPPYENQEYRDELQKIIELYKSMGNMDKAAQLEKQMFKEPRNPFQKDWTWEEEIEAKRKMAMLEKDREDILAGKVMLDPIPVEQRYERQDIIDMVESMVKRGEPLAPYISANIPVKTQDRIVDLTNKHIELLAQLGFTNQGMKEVHYLSSGYYPSSPWVAMYPVAAKARNFNQGKKDATWEKVEKAVAYLEREIEDVEAKHKRVRERAFTWDVKYHIWNSKELPNFQSLVKLAGKWGVTDRTTIREQAELAMVQVARTIAMDNTMSPFDQYTRILELYNKFPTLSYRTNEIKEKQQYSTPVPISFLMGEYTNAKEASQVMDPSAGNGSLLISANKSSTRANDIDTKRFENLIEQGYRAFNVDSNHGIAKYLDVQSVPVIHINPPFGGPTEDYNGYKLASEYVPVAYALESLSETGKAGVIVGGHVKFRPNGQMIGQDLIFFNWLNKYFNVEDVIQIPGEFYKTMGAAYPIKMILINGRKVVPEGAAPLYSDKFEPIDTWTELRDRVMMLKSKPNDKNTLQRKVDADRGSVTPVGGEVIPKNPSKNDPRLDPVDPGQIGTPVITGKPRDEGDVDPREVGPDTGARRTRADRSDNVPPSISKPDGATDPTDGGTTTGQFGKIQSVRGREDLPVNNIGKPNERTKRELGLNERTGDEVSPYIPLSGIGSGNFIVPASIAIEVEESLMELKDEIGDVDEYVRGKLNYNSKDDMKSSFFAEQVDGIAQAIYNIEGGNSMIIGHQTGTGKGRIAAGTIRYAIENGKLPVFITKSADLFTDMYRDLVNIGSPSYQPFMMNKQFASSGQKVKIFHPNTGEVVYEVDENQNNRIIGKGMSSGTGILPEGTQYIMTTYSQFTTEGRDDAKREFLKNLTRDNDVVFIMDESHDASGMSNTGEYFMDWLQMTTGGVFLSATYAKRPDNMPLYSMKTVLKESNMNLEELVDAIKAGGPALQEIITLQLAEAGQFSKIGFKMDAEMNYLVIGDTDPTQRTYDPEKGEKMVNDFDRVTTMLQEIIRFQSDHIDPVLKAMNEAIKKEGMQIGARKGTSQAGISNTPYFSRVWSVIDQLLLASKVKEAIPLIVEDLKAGKKPVVALKSTMEAMFNHMVADGHLAKGETIPLDFSHVLKRGMHTVMKYTEKDAQGDPLHLNLGPENLTDAGRDQYYTLMEQIQDLSTGIPVSPIDVLRRGIVDAGFDFVEITGRSTMFEMNEDMTSGTFVTNDRGDKIKAVAKFNNTPGVVAIINRAGSTGISMHSSPDFKDISQRSMYILQNDLDINVVVQILGRVYRADQLNKPIYNILTSLLPAELRMFMMNAKKLKSLDANTSGNQKQSKSLVDVPDFLNKYGDEVVAEYLKENPHVNNMIGDPLNISSDDPNKQNAAHRVTGRIQILPSYMQDEFNRDVVDRYEQVINYLNSTGTNDLMVTSEELGAEFVGSDITIHGNGGYSTFGDNTVLNAAEVNVTRKPYTKAQLEEQLESVPDTHIEDITEAMNKGVEEALTWQIENAQKQYEESINLWRKKIEEKQGLTPEDKGREFALKENELEQRMNDRIEGLRAVSEGNKYKFSRYFNYFKPGRGLEIPFTDDDQLDLVRMNKGVFLSFDINMNKPSPWIQSNVQLRFATTDGRKTFKIPVSKSGHLDAIMDHSQHLSPDQSRDILDNWDNIKKARNREVRYLVTGNVLQGMNVYKKGRLIQFSMADGTIERGIMMPENWTKPDSNIARMPINKSINTIKALAPRDFIEDISGDIIISKLEYGSPQMYELKVPASTKRGSKYYSNEDIKSIVKDGFFEQKNNRMVAQFPERNLQNLIDVLNDRFKIVMEADSKQVQKGSDNTESFQSLQTYGQPKPRKAKNRRGLPNPYHETNGLDIKGTNGRIVPDPVPSDGPTKKLWEIQADVSKAIGKKIQYTRRPSTRRASGAYQPATGKLGIKYFGDEDTAAHEIGHYIDDRFGLLGPEAQDIWAELKEDLSDLWDFGSKVPRGHPNPEQYRMQEGYAEFIRAWLVNPLEAKNKYHTAYNWFVERVSPHKEIWAGLVTFGHDIRTVYGSSAGDQLMANVKLDPEKTRAPWAFTRENRENQFQVTMWDKMGRRIWYFMDPLVEAYKYGMKQHGVTDIMDPSQIKPDMQFEILARNHLGIDVKLQNIMEKGLVNFDGVRVMDPVTGKPLSFNLLYEQIPGVTSEEYETNIYNTFKYGIAERAVELPRKYQARMIRSDLENTQDMLPPLEILKLHPHIINMYESKINDILERLSEGKLLDKDVWIDPDGKEGRYDFTDITITGSAQWGIRDYDLAKEAVEDFKAMETTDPDMFNAISEFWRVYREIGEQWSEYAHQAGLMSESTMNQIQFENLSYVAMNRLMAVEPKDLVEGGHKTEFAENKPTGTGLLPREVVFPFKGSDRPIDNPVSSLIRSWMKLVDVGDMNYVVASFAQAFSVQMSERIPRKDPVTKQGEIAWVSTKPEPMSIMFYIDGKKKWLVFGDQYLYDNWKNLLPPSSSWLVKTLSFAPQLLRRAITVSLRFVTRNIIRDAGHWSIVGEAKKYAKFRDVFPDKEMDDKFELFGGGQFGFVHRSRRGHYSIMKKAMMSGFEGRKGFWHYNPWALAKKGGEWLYRQSQMSERPVRRLQFKASYREGIEKLGLNEVEAATRAAYIARDLMDFAAAGTYVRELNKIFIFTGAAVRGIDKIVRTAKRDPLKASVMAGGFITNFTIMAILPSIMNSILMAMMANDEDKEEYLSHPDYLRDGFYRIPLNGEWLILPKPFELGKIGSIPQRILDHYLLGDEYAFSDNYLRSMFIMLWPYDVSTLMGGYSGAFQAITNYDVFRDKYIVPPNEKDLAIVSRNTENASRVGKWIQEASDLFTKEKNKPLVDARKVDAFLIGQFSSWAEYFLGLVELTAGKNANKRIVPSMVDTGLMKTSQVYGTKHVQWVLRSYKNFPHLKIEGHYEELGNLLTAYFSEEYQSDKRKMEELDDVIRVRSLEIRKELEKRDLYQEAKDLKTINRDKLRY